jgi:hypothetical protein
MIKYKSVYIQQQQQQQHLFQQIKLIQALSLHIYILYIQVIQVMADVD